MDDGGDGGKAMRIMWLKLGGGWACQYMNAKFWKSALNILRF